MPSQVNVSGFVKQNDATNKLEVAGVPVSPYEYTFAALMSEASTAFAGIFVRITDRHTGPAGVGGVVITGGASWSLISSHIYYATYSLRPTAGTIPNLSIRCGDVGGGLITLIDNGTRYMPEGRIAVMAGETFGTLATPTNTRGSTGEFTISNATFPANLFAVGDRLRLNLRFRKTGAVATYYVRAVLGTTVDVGNAMLWEATSTAATTGYDINSDSLLMIGSSTVLTTNRSNTLAGAGAAPASYDVTTNFSITSALILGIWLGSITSTDTAALIGYSLMWEV